MAYSAILIAPAALRDKTNRAAAALGLGPETLTLELVNDAGAVTHWGAHMPLTDAQIATLIAATGGTFPEGTDWAAHGLTLADVVEVLSNLVIDAPGSALDALSVVDINSADQARLETLPGVGAVMAAAIISGRPWAALGDTTAISGVGQATVASWAGLASAGPRPAHSSGSEHLNAVLAAHGLTRI